MKGIYKIKNTVTGEYYIGSSKNLQTRILSHKVLLKNNKHTNYKLQESYNKYGKNLFVFYEIEVVSDDKTKDDLIKLEQKYLDGSDKSKLFNINFTATATKEGVIFEECCILSLNGKVFKEFGSVSECFRWLQAPINVLNLNLPITYKKKFRVVTKDFFNNNIDIIKSWDCCDTSNFDKGSKSNSFKNCKIYCDFNGEVLEFDDYKHISIFLKIAQSSIISILKKQNIKNPFNIRIDR